LYSQTAFQDLELVLEDLLLISDRFVTPGADGAAYQATGGWASTAKNLDLFQIDASIHINSLFIPRKRREFIVNNSDFNALRIRGAESITIPTVLGGDTNVFFDFDIDGDPNEFQAFEGINENQLFHPFLQTSIGLWKKTDLTVRYSPTIKISDGEYGIFGLGLKHSVSQYFVKEEDSNNLEVAVQVAYSRFNSNFLFDTFQVDAPEGDLLGIPLLSVNRLDVTSDTWVFQALASKRFNNLEFFGGFGIITGDVQFEMSGEQSLFLGLLNNLLEGLDPTRTLAKGDVGINYHFGNFYVSNAFTFGELANYNLSFHYKI